MKDMDAQARVLFERSVQRLDAGAANRLRLARRAALAQDEGRGVGRRALPPLLAASAALLLGLAWWLPQRASAPATPAAGAEDMVMVEEADDAELYAWLAEAPVAAEAPAGEHRL